MKCCVSSPPAGPCRCGAPGRGPARVRRNAWQRGVAALSAWRTHGPSAERWWPSSPCATGWSAAPASSRQMARKERQPMLRELSLFGALAPSLLLYFLAAIPLFVIVDRVMARLGVYRLAWHPPLVQISLFVCIFTLLVFSTAT